MTKLQPVPQKEEKSRKSISGKSLNPLKCKKVARTVLKPSQYHKFEIVGKDGTQAVIGTTLFIHRSVGEFPERIRLKVEV